MNADLKHVLRGAAIGIMAGLAASLAMNGFQSLWSAASGGSGSGDRDGSEPSTVKAAERVSETVLGQPLPDEAKPTAGEAVHYGFGALLGGLYGAIGEVVPAVRTGFGTGYGAAVALTADELLVPALGLSPGPRQVPWSSHLYGFVSHLVFGLSLEGSRRLIARGPV